jgi:hypothetical protein
MFIRHKILDSFRTVWIPKTKLFYRFLKENLKDIRIYFLISKWNQFTFIEVWNKNVSKKFLSLLIISNNNNLNIMETQQINEKWVNALLTASCADE